MLTPSDHHSGACQRLQETKHVSFNYARYQLDTAFIEMTVDHKDYKAGERYEIDKETAQKWADAELCSFVESSFADRLEQLEKTIEESQVKLVDTISKAMRVEPKIPAQPKSEDDKSLGDWFKCAYKAEHGSGDDRNLYFSKYGSKQQNTNSGTAGGYLVPTEYSSQMIEVSDEQAIVRPRADVHNMSSKTLEIPALDQNGNFRGGLTTYYVEEVNAGITESSLTFRNIELHAKDLNCLIYVTSDLLEDSAVNLQGYIERKFREAITSREDLEYLTGNGVNGPLGIVNSDCLKSTSRDGSGSTITFNDIVAMEENFLPESLNAGRGVWVCHQSTMDQVAYLKDSAGNPIYLESGRTGGFPMLRGKPVLFTGKTNSLNSLGDILLCDFSYYVVGMRRDVEISFSEHLRFHRNQIAFKATFRHDGQPALDSVVTLDDGSTTVSPFVGLAAN